MTATATKVDGMAEPEVLITRIYEAPRQLVWDALTQPQHLEQWFGPHGFANHSAKVELREGGEYSSVMQGPGGFERTAAYTVTVVSPIDRLELESSDGRDPSADDYFRVRMIFELEERGTQTLLTLTGLVLASGPKAQSPFTGGQGPWSQTLERLGGTIGSLVIDAPADEPVITISRLFKASRDLVWEAISKPEHLKEWWGPRAATNISVEMDWRIGGTWRVVQRFPDGREFVFKGEYREIVPPEKVVQTFGMEGEYAGAEMVETMTLTPLGDVTLLKVTSQADTIESRDGMLASGMSQGANETYQRLEEYLAKL